MQLTRPKALIFDWDNTLVDTWVTIHHALKVTFEAMEMEPWTLDEARQRVRASARDSFPTIFGARAAAAMEIFYRTFEADHLAKLQELPGAGAMLADLQAAGDLYLAVVSNKQGRILRREAEHLGWSRHFTRLVGANDAPRDKPARDAVDLVLQGSGVGAGPDVWFVGDTDIDMLCAANSGCVPILIRPAPPIPDEFGASAPRAHFRDCAAFAQSLRGL